jgi:hypothetical protein
MIGINIQPGFILSSGKIILYYAGCQVAICYVNCQ